MEPAQKSLIPNIVDWDGCDINEPCESTIKIDGVRGIWDGTTWLSRTGKPLYNIPPAPAPGDYEIYLGSHKQTIIATRTQYPDATTPKIEPEHLYQLAPTLDSRLRHADHSTLTAEQILYIRDAYCVKGFEGLVIRTATKWHKVKMLYTMDVVINDAIIGKGKHAGKLGAVITDLGKVGTGFDDRERAEFWSMHQQGELVGKVIEVYCMELTEDDKFRHPRFIRLREDKA